MPEKRYLWVFLLAGFICYGLDSQAQPQKWGDISEDNLMMEPFVADSNASAVVLFDVGKADFGKNLNYTFQRHVRIKVLREKGYPWATVEIHFNRRYEQEVDEIEGITYTLENGEVRKMELDRDQIFEEEIDDEWSRISFTLPSVTPGSIIEYRYTKKLGNPEMLEGWTFQKSIPVRWSEYRVEIPGFLRFHKILQGRRDLDFNDVDSYMSRIRYDFESEINALTTRKKRRMGWIRTPVQSFRWGMRDLPAVREVPFIKTVDDYKSKIWLQLAEININDRYQRDILKTWRQVVDELLEDDRFGGRLSTKPMFPELVNEIAGAEQTSLERTKSIFSFVRSSMKWDGVFDLVSKRELDEVYETKTGSGVEINLLLTQLLRDAGIEAHPVVISTGSHGKIMEKFPIVNQFNHVISYVDFGGTGYFLDAAGREESIYLPPLRNLNGKGLVIKREALEWVEPKAHLGSRKNVTVEAGIQPDGTIQGTFKATAGGYFGSKERSSIRDMGIDDFLQDRIFGRFVGVELDSARMISLSNPDKPLGYNSRFVLNGSQASASGSEVLYFNPMLLLREYENPLKGPERQVPVEFPYEYRKSFTGSYRIPGGYVVEEIPESRVLRLQKGGGYFKRDCEVKGDHILISSVLSIEKPFFNVKESRILSIIFREIVEIHSENVVLKKADDNQTIGNLQHEEI